ncbi:MAG: ATP synthase F1 subunit delta [Prolixibacteraceae bacterium]|nr:ATP synthase F1 subunit delta [Prolixibacteraceae bacterium]
MDQSAITVRYAKAFFTLAKEKNQLSRLTADVQLVSQVCSESTDFILLLESPIVKISKKMDLISAIFKNKIEGVTLDFLLLITKNKREINIPGICRNFLELARKDQNIKSAVLTTAAEINSETIRKIEKLLGKEFDAKIELATNINPEIIGGLVLRLDDKQYDASIATQLKKIKQKLLESELK